MNDVELPWFSQDTTPLAGLCLERHLVIGFRPAEGQLAVALCGRTVLVGPPPQLDVDAVEFQAVRPCWHCHDVVTGHRDPPRPPAASEFVRIVRHRDRAGSCGTLGHLRAAAPSDSRTRCGVALAVSDVDLLDPSEVLLCGTCLGAHGPQTTAIQRGPHVDSP